MDSIDSLKKQIETAKDLEQIVSTMKALAATNIKKYEKTSFNISKYLNNIYSGFHAIVLKNREILDTISFIENNVNKDLKKQDITIVIGSNQGLCGRFNGKIVDFFINDTKNIDFNIDSNVLITIGDKIQLMLEAEKINIDKHISLPNSIESVVDIVNEVFKIIEEYSKKSKAVNVFVYFTQYDNKSNGILTKKKIIPLEQSFFKKFIDKKWPTNNIPMWRINTELLFSDLVKQYIFSSVYYAIATSMASEQKNRLLTLQGAEDNIKKNIADITLICNQKRQNETTAELIDVVSGYKLLKKNIDE